MFWHIETDVISIIAIAAIYICNRSLPPQVGNERRDRRFARCLETGIGITAVDIAASIIMDVPTAPLLYHILMTAYFVCIELGIVEWFLYVLTILYHDNERKQLIMARVALYVYALYALFVLSNPWTGFIYTLGPDNAYARGPFFSVMLVLYCIYVLTLLVLILVKRKHISGEFSSGVLLATPVILSAGIAAQLLCPGTLLILPAYMICFLLAFLFLQTMRVRNSMKLVDRISKVAETDKLTGLYNRVGMEAMVMQALKDQFGLGVVVLIADIDDLKVINDTMGHAEGDRSIRLVADSIKKHFRMGDTVVRYGGDEFLAFFAGRLDEAHIRQSLERLVDEIGRLRIGANNDFPLHGSIGAAYGVIGSDSFETLCIRADTALYHVKRNGKNGYALYSPELERPK